MAALADAVEVAVDLVVLAPWEERRAVNDPAADPFISGRFGERAQHEVDERQSGFFNFLFFFSFIYKAAAERGLGFLGVLDCTCRGKIRSVRCHTEPVRLLCTRPVELFYYTDMLYSIRNLHK